MKYLSMMTEDEIRYVCAVIPARDAVGYFQHNPKEFSKICPGFRASAVAKLDVSNLIFRNRSRSFVEFYIEKHISDWLSQIQEHIAKCMKDRDNRVSALLKTLPHSFFVANISLYFKLIGEEYTEETLGVLDASIKVIKDSDSECARLQTALNAKTTVIGRTEAELERIQSELSKTNKKLSENLDAIKILKRSNADLEKRSAVIASLEQTIMALKIKEQEREQYIQLLRVELSAVKDENIHLEQRIREELVKQQESEKYKQDTQRKPKCPQDLDEFRDYLGYCLENIGVPTDADYYPLLKDHLSEILFQGKPIIISRSTGFTLMRCVTNTLVKTPAVLALAFANEVTEKTIDDFLSQNERVLCLDNFIGNYNETSLVTICERHRDKIIFLTVAYDHTLAYVPDELMRYCHYLNLNRIEAFVGEKELTEDPSDFEEAETSGTSIVSDSRWSAALKEILGELGVRGALSAYKSCLVINEMYLCRILAFDVLPYCTDVLKIAPFSISGRLVQYAGAYGRCRYKDLFLGWFA